MDLEELIQICNRRLENIRAMMAGAKEAGNKEEVKVCKELIKQWNSIKELAERQVPVQFQYVTDEMVRCPDCGTQFSIGFENCGLEEIEYCPYCGRKVG